MTKKESKRTLRERGRWASAAAWSIVHVLGVSVVLLVLVMLTMPIATAKMAAHVTWQIPELRELATLDGLIVLGLAMCLWALGVITFELLRRRRRFDSKLALKRARGTAITETLIILPPFLLLTFGLSQVSVNFIAGMLANVAAYQAGRSAWLWQPEQGKTRVNASVTESDVTERARIAAALVMTPSAPGMYSMLGFSSSDKANRMCSAMMWSFMPVPMGANIANVIANNFNGESSIGQALDSTSFFERSAAKCMFAYQATTAEIKTGGGIGANIKYKQFQAFPFVNRYFGQPDRVGVRMGYYVEIEREYVLPAQRWAARTEMPNNSPRGGGPSHSTDWDEGAVRSEADPSGEL